MHLQKMQPIFFCCQADKYSTKGSFHNYVDIILPFLDHIPTSVGTVFILNMDKNRHFWITSSCPHSYWMPPQAIINFQHQRTDFYTCISIGFLKIFSPDCLSSWGSNVGKHSFLMIKTHYLTQKFHKWQHLIKKNVAVFLRQQSASQQTSLWNWLLLRVRIKGENWE